MRRLVIPGIAVLLVAVSANGDHKRVSFIWTYNAMAATPLPQTAAQDLLIASHGSVRIKDGKTGRATLICPVVATDRLQGHELHGLSVTYRDGDDSRGRSVVSAVLKRVRPTGVSQVVQNIVRVSSNDDGAEDSGDTGWRIVSSNAGRGHVFAFDEYYYYVQVTLQKNGSRAVGVMGVTITSIK